MAAGNPLVLTNKTTDQRLSVQVHPLVLLTISDYLTRYILRNQTGAIAGILIGAQNGPEVTVEHAFEVKTAVDRDGHVVLDIPWFQARLSQYQDVHKEPQLDIVGWFTICPPTGPQPQHLPIQSQLLQHHGEPLLLLLFHPESVADGTSKGGKLPLSIYESVQDNTSSVEQHGQAPRLSDGTPLLPLKFQEAPYTIETGEAEMIAVDFVAKGGANAAVRTGSGPGPGPGPGTGTGAMRKDDVDGKGKKRSAPDGDVKLTTPGGPEQDYLTPEDDDKIATLTSKANAVRMLQQRITLIKRYLESVPRCYLNDAGSIEHMAPDPRIQHGVLRSVAALLARLPLLAPSTPASRDGPAGGSQFGREAAAEATDVALVSLLGHLGGMLEAAQTLGTKSATIEGARRAQGKPGHFGQRFTAEQAGGMMDEDHDEGIDASMVY